MRQNRIVERSKFLHAVAVVIFCVVTLTSRTLAQESQKAKPQPQPEDVVRVYTDLVQTDIMVFDKHGAFVNGLKREDFELRIDGKPQPIDFFERIAAGSADEEMQLSAARGAARPDQKVAGPVPLDRGRAIFFYVDDFHLSAGDLTFLRKALLKFVDNDLGQNDEAVVTSASGQIGFLQQLTDNKVVLRAAIDRIKARPYYVRDNERPLMTEYQALQIDRVPVAMDLTGVYLGDVFEYFVRSYKAEAGASDEVSVLHVQNRARAILQQAAGITVNTLDGLKALIRSSSQLPGRKLLFFISDGFFIDRRNADTAERLQSMTRAAAQNGVVIYSLDARALTTGLPTAGDEVEVDRTGMLARGSIGELPMSREAMETLAFDTGGRTIFDTNALDVGLTKALKETSEYYLLAWRSNHEEASARKPRRIEVNLVGRRDLTVRIRRDYANVEPAKNLKAAAAKEQKGADESPEAKLRKEIGGIYPSRDLPVALDLTYLNTANKGPVVTISMQVPIDSLSSTIDNGKEKAVVDVAGSVYDDQGKMGASFKQRVTITPPQSSNQLRHSGDVYPYQFKVALPPGLYQIRVGARDEQSGKVGTVHQWIQIPDLNAHKLALSSVMAGELLEPQVVPAANNQSVPPQLLSRVDHRFHRFASLRFLLYVYNAARAAADSKPDLAVQTQVLRDGQPVLTTPMAEVLTAGIQDFDRLPCGADLPLASLTRGHYLLQITVIDRISKTSASQQMRFDVE
jgi:VWFA-related protein